jgi:predicted ferric reductase
MHLIMAVSDIKIITERFSDYWSWYIVRATGFIAAGILFLLIISGIGQVTGFIYRYVEPIKSWLIHKTLAIMLLIAIALHGGFLLINNYIKFNLLDVLVPFASTYSNGTVFGLNIGALGVTFGIFATYIIVFTVLVSLKIIDSHKRLWRKLHFLSYLAVFLVFLHAIYVGTDLKFGFFRDFWILAGFLLFLAVIYRLWRAKVLK